MNNIEEKAIKLYRDGKSTYEVGEILNKKPNQIRRMLMKCGEPLRSKSEAQKIALDVGRTIHPTKGKKRSEATKVKISESIYTNWQEMSDVDKKLRSDKAKEQWSNMSEADKEALRSAAAAAVRKASKEGSKLEQFLQEQLIEAGYNVQFHQKHIIQNIDLEIDLLLPDLGVAIEIDGPSHFLPIWGEEKLQKHIKADADKAGLLLTAGYAIIRVKYVNRILSEKYKRELWKLISKTLKKIEKKFPKKGDRYIELEVDE